MADVTVPFGFELPIEGELFSTALIRRNFQLTNDLMPKFGIAVSTFKNTTWDFSTSRFTKISTSNNEGIIVAEITGKCIVATTLNSDAYTEFIVAPAGFKGDYNIVPTVVGMAGSGVNQSIQAGWGSNGRVFIRRNGPTNINLQASTQFSFSVSYRWNGA